MSQHISYLKKSRKQSHLSQDDVMYLLGINNKSLLSRYENGERHPHVHHLIIFYLIYNKDIEELYEPLICIIQEEVAERLKTLIEHKERKGGSTKIQRRKQYLKDVLNRLTIK